jgi:MFS family permease
MGAFASIYHPGRHPDARTAHEAAGAVIGVNGLVGNLGIAVAAVMTGLLVKYFGWRMAFVVPGLITIALGILFWRVVPQEQRRPRGARQANRSSAQRAREAVLVLTVTSTCGSLVFNFTTNGNGELMADRLRNVTADPAVIGACCWHRLRRGVVSRS